MTAQPLAPVIPSSAGPAARGRRAAGAGRPLPLAAPGAVRQPRRTWSTGSAASTPPAGSADRAVISALGWRGGDRLTLTADAGVVTARRDPGGMVTLPASAYIAIPGRAAPPLRPASPATGCCWPQLPGDDTLTACSLAVVDQAIRAHGAFPHAQGGQP